MVQRDTIMLQRGVRKDKSESAVWTNQEKKRNIEDKEHPLVEDKGGFKRKTHKTGSSSGVEEVKTKSSTSTEEKRQNTIVKF